MGGSGAVEVQDEGFEVKYGIDVGGGSKGKIIREEPSASCTGTKSKVRPAKPALRHWGDRLYVQG